ncbi:cobalamin biosynthesis protein CobG [Streptomyces albireticuli]|uniref:Cobalamin biosynthesis protein CobG n=2 Tax=Streptomyces albireticuli TaxID=1940 RepID=A0A2A2DFJ6_9ACTN|nr:cobalamin biosynthesis protein CobG [Streptomyces albireticuli]
MLAAMPSTPALSSDRDDSGAGAPAAGPVRERGDACPGALRLHAADDGALARVRLPGGLLTARQAVALARCAEQLGDGHLDLTSRGNVQLRGLATGCGGTLAEALRPSGLLPSDRHDRIRNVVASPLCGLDDWRPDSGSGPDGGIPAADPAAPDVQAWVRELDGLLCSDDGPADLAGLSGRFLFGLDDGRGDIVALRPDVTLIASGDGRADLYFGTSGPGLRVLAGDAPRAAVLAAAGFLAALESGGATAWRVRELPPGRRPTTARLADRLTAAGIAHTPLPPTRLPSGEPAGPGRVTGPDGLCALSVTAPLGRLTVAQWRLVTDVAGEGSGGIRVTPWRGLVVPGLPPAKAPRLLAALADAGFVTSTASAWHGAGACAGRPGCAKSRADVRADAAAALGRRRSAGLPVYWSGCERRCGHPGGRWVDVLAADGGYEVTERDGTWSGPARRVAAATGPAGLADAVAAARSGTRARTHTTIQQ